ncbi:hypothetical protein PVK06_002635 [Gossypium arboreum]|uniref:Uncharacterized protein n=1 Tax=Gossypium arboreum TaxID=29729 RepID=A0ABR0R4C0_GOSAR|nr:hypothetical protein PVK06_002635 [Gossypium arboreum]
MTRLKAAIGKAMRGLNRGWIGGFEMMTSLEKLVKSNKPDFVFFVETLIHSNKLEELHVALQFDTCFSIDQIGRSDGLAFLWNFQAQVSVWGYSNNHTDLLIKVVGFVKWRLTWFYGANWDQL